MHLEAGVVPNAKKGRNPGTGCWKQKEGKMKYLKKCEKSRKRLDALFSKLEGRIIVVEGKRDAEALAHLGFGSYAAAGRVRSLVSRVLDSETENPKRESCVVLTDLDDAGDELALLVRSELEPYVKCDIETRKRIGAILDFRHFEDIERKLEKFNEENKVE